MNDWNEEKTLAFIEDYRMKPALWDTRTDEYKKTGLKNRNLHELAVKYGTDVTAIRQRIKNLRTMFHREHRKQTNLDSSQIGYCKTWYGYGAMSFILDAEPLRMIPFKRSSVDRLSDEYAERSSPIIVSITESEAEARQDEEDEDDPAAQQSVAQQAAAAVAAAAAAAGYGPPLAKHSKGVKRRRLEYAVRPPSPEPAPAHAPAPSPGARRAQQQQQQHGPARDKFASFSEYVASQLRELTPSAQNITMYVINTALFNAAMGLYDDLGGTPGGCTINLIPSAVYIQEEALNEEHK